MLIEKTDNRHSKLNDTSYYEFSTLVINKNFPHSAANTMRATANKYLYIAKRKEYFMNKIKEELERYIQIIEK